MIGRLRATLRATRRRRNTYIVFSSDNGFHLGQHRLTPGKLTAFDTDVRVPLIVAGPGVRAGRTVDAMTENIDLCPTFAELGRAPAPPTASTATASCRCCAASRRAATGATPALIEHHGPDNGDERPRPAAPPAAATRRRTRRSALPNARLRRVRGRRARVLRPRVGPVPAAQPRPELPPGRGSRRTSAASSPRWRAATARRAAGRRPGACRSATAGSGRRARRAARTSRGSAVGRRSTVLNAWSSYSNRTSTRPEPGRSPLKPILIGSVALPRLTAIT